MICQAVCHRRWAGRSWRGRPQTSGWRCRVPATRWHHARPRPHLCSRRARPRPRSPLTPPSEAQVLLMKQGSKHYGYDMPDSQHVASISESAASTNDVNTSVATSQLLDLTSAKEDTAVLDSADALRLRTRVEQAWHTVPAASATSAEPVRRACYAPSEVCLGSDGTDGPVGSCRTFTEGAAHK